MNPAALGSGHMAEVALFAVVAWGWWPYRARVGFGRWPALLVQRLGSIRPRPALVAMGVVAGALATPVLTGVVVFGLLALRRVRRRALSQRSHQRAVAALPGSLELCNVVLGAGGTIFDCLRILAASGPDPVRDVAIDSVRIASAGSRLDTALCAFRDQLGLTFQPLTGALLLGWRQGGSVGLLLARLTSEANASRRRLADLRARRLPVLLLLPLVVFTLPAVIVGTVVPVVVVAVRDLDL